MIQKNTNKKRFMASVVYNSHIHFFTRIIIITVSGIGADSEQLYLSLFLINNYRFKMLLADSSGNSIHIYISVISHVTVTS